MNTSATIEHLEKIAVVRAVGRLAVKALALTTGSVNTPNNGKFKIPRTISPSTYWMLIKGTYEDAESQVLDEDFQSDDLIIDIGSNIGYVSRRACGKLNPKGTLVCVEADPKNLPYLEANLQEARRSHDIHIIGAAVGAPTREGESTNFRQCSDDLCSSLREVSAPGVGQKIIQVPVRSLSSIIAAFDSGNKGFSLICDAEGAEILILQKDPESLRRCRQVAIELHHPKQTGSQVTADDMIAIFHTLGFVRKRVVKDTHYFSRETEQASTSS